EGSERAREAALKAIALAPDLAEAHSALGRIQTSYDWDWNAAEASHRRAFELAPGSADVLLDAGALAIYRGRLEEALEMYRRTVEQDPLSSAGCNRLANSYTMLGRFAQAREAFL